MEYKRIYPDLAEAHTALSVCFTAKELLSAEIDKDAIDFDPQYQKKTEFRKLFDLWKDPLYLADFFEANLSFFQDPYWNGISEKTFVSDVVASSRVIFEQIEELIKSGELLKQFASLDDAELKKMEMVARDLDKNDVFDKESFIDFITE